jgi:hypothetical protein
MYRVLILTCLLVFTYVHSVGQTHSPCGTSQIHDQLLKEDSVYKRNVELFEQQTQQFVRDQRAVGLFTKKAGVYTIPVVVHVVHLGEPIGSGTNISDAVIQQAILGLNQRFRNLIGNGSTDMEVEFCLAAIDPNGMSTTGINRVNGTSVSMYGSGGISITGCTTAGSETAIKNLSRWPNTDYYNIWVVKDICNGTAGGYAYFPGASASVDGTVVSYNQFGHDDASLAHELGHGFGLYHTFEGDGGGGVCPPNASCLSDGDRCCDTPPHKRNDCSSTNPCTASGVWNNSMYNVMAYCLYNWPNQISYGRFTDNQKSRVQSSINGSRFSLTVSGKCGAIPPPASCAPANDNCSGSVLLMDTNAFVYTNGTLECATNDSTMAISSCNGGSPTQKGVFYKFVARGTSTTVIVNPFNITNVGVDAVVVVYAGTDCGTLTQIACSNPPGFTYISLPVTGLVAGNTYWVRVYHSGATQPLTGQARFQICIRRGLSTCSSPVALVADASGTDAVTFGCKILGGSGGTVAYKWYKGLTCAGLVVGTDSAFTATQSGYYVCKAYIEGFESTCSSCDPGLATINYSCTSPSLSVNDSAGTDSVLMTAKVPAGTAVLYKWYKDSVCSGNVVGTDSVYMARSGGYYSCMAYVDGYDFVCYACDKGYATVNPSCTAPVVNVNDVSGIDSVQLTATSVGGSGGTVVYKWYQDSVCGGAVIGSGATYKAKVSGYYSCKAFINGREDLCYTCDKAYATVTPYSNDIVMSESGTYTRCFANFYDGGNKNGNYPKKQNVVVTILPSVPGAKISVTFHSFKTQTSYKDSTDTTHIDHDILYVYNGNSIAGTQIGALMGKTLNGTITSTAADGSLTFKFVSNTPRVLADSNSRSGWTATVTCNYVPADIAMVASGTYVTCGGHFYDGGGATGDYPDNQKSITPSGGSVVTIMPAVSGKKVSVRFNSFATQTQYKDVLNQSQQNDDVLTVYNGNTTLSPLLKSLQGIRTSDTVTSTAADGSLTFKFVSSTPFTIPAAGTSRAGWSGMIECLNPIPPPTGLNDLGKPVELKVYPNPTNRTFYIVSKDIQSGRFTLTLTNILGQEMGKKELTVNGKILETTMDVEHLADGVYYLMISSDTVNHVVKVQKQTH